MLNPLLIWFTALGAVPIIIHLLNKRRYRPVTWAAMEFLIQAIQKNARRLQLRDIILMLIRAAAISMLALALTRPTINAKSFIGGTKTGAVILLDNSLSMGYTTGGTISGRQETRFDVAKKLAVNIIDQLAQDPGSWCALYTFNGDVRAPIGDPSQNLTYIKQEMETAATLSDGSTNIEKAFEKAAQIIDRHPEFRLANREVYVITDMQAYPWSVRQTSAAFGKALKDLSDKAAVYLVNAGDNAVENAAVLELTPRDSLVTVDTPVECVAKIKNFGQTDVKNLVVDFFVDPVSSDERISAPTQRFTVNIDHGETSSVSFETKFATGGDHRISCKLADDRLPNDGRRFCSIEVIDEAKVLLVDGKDQRVDDPVFNETGFLRYALSPKDPENPDKQNVISTDVITYHRLADTNILNYQAVVLSNVPRLQPQTVTALEKQVKNGMGLMIFLGDQVDPASYNALLGETGAKLLPAKIGAPWGEAVSADADKYPPAITYSADKLSHPIMVDFNGTDGVELLSQVKIYRGFDLEVPAKDDAVRPVASYANGKVAAVERRIGSGYVLLFASPATTSWSNLPTQPAFVVMMTRAANMLTLGNRPPKNISVGSQIRAQLPLADQNTPVHITPPYPGSPKDTKPDLTPDQHVVVDINDTDHAGFYEIALNRVPKVTMAYAVNPDTELESNLNTTTPEQLRHDYPEFKFTYISKNDDLSNKLTQERKGSELWPWLIGMVFVLLALESFLANKWAPRD
ncbi:MAG TPA: VWA domain-containing protein [Planctomycetota bacterium]|nr:VWA domain-containing protein [Planctomycetota bacterium]